MSANLKDHRGLFWDATKDPEKCHPPEKVWLKPGYLPGLDAARRFDVPLLTDQELFDLCAEEHTLKKPHQFIYDIEIWPNYALIGFLSVTTKKVAYIECIGQDGQWRREDLLKLDWIVKHSTLVGFNNLNFDIYILSLISQGFSPLTLARASHRLVVDNVRGYEILKEYKTRKVESDQIDISEVAPGVRISLKLYGGRVHTKTIQDLPYPPEWVLTDDQITIARYYNINDLNTTLDLYSELQEEMRLRLDMGQEYGLDLRSKSDAQIAEAVIRSELTKALGYKPKAPSIEYGKVLRYDPPSMIDFVTPRMREVLAEITATEFVVGHDGKVRLPENIENLEIRLGHSTYRLGIGGLHSSESSTAHHSNESELLLDIDGTSYYPYIMSVLGMFPEHLGPAFCEILKILTDRRVKAKREKLKKIADRLKITINGIFGKLGDIWSIIYSPELMIRVTLTGQLLLLMLAERCELSGIPIVNGNTDGIVAKAPRDKLDTLKSICDWWQARTGINLEYTPYLAILSRDVNCYLAIKHPDTWEPDAKIKDKIKAKGTIAGDTLSKNPFSQICVDAVKALLLDGTPLDHTILNSRDITRFVVVQRVTGGAVKMLDSERVGDYLGKVARWYYAANEPGYLVYAKTGKRVPVSDGAKPLMTLPDEFPSDIDYDWYLTRANNILDDIGLKTIGCSL